MFKIKYKLGSSSIHGIGVYAGEKIAKGTVVWEWDWEIDEEISQEDFDEMSNKKKGKILHFGYKSKNTGKYYYSETDVHFINHSENGNSTEIIDQKSGAGVMIAKRIINGGEEITQDYRKFEGIEDLRRRGIEFGDIINNLQN